MLTAAVLMNEGMDVTAALDHIRSRRPRMAFSASQMAAVYEYATTQ